MTTFSELIQKTIVRISQVPGTGVQLYAEDRIGDMIQHKFNVLFDEIWWRRFIEYTPATLDGATGVVTSNLSAIYKRWEDLYGIWYERDTKPLPAAPLNFNVMNVTEGTRPRFVTPSANPQKLFKLWPVTSTGNVLIIGRTKPDNFTANDEVPFDDDALILGAAYDYLEDDAANPGSIEKFQVMFEQRVETLKKLQNNMPLPLDPNMHSINEEWQVTG